MPGPLEAHLRSLIAATGPITVARFMAEALSHPKHGYYRTRDPLGAGGDFTTAPEISQVFGELIGAWCAVVWQQAGRCNPVRLVELGPGRGTLMADLLRVAERVAPDFAAHAEVHLVEISPVLRTAQKAALGERPQWHDSLESVPEGPLVLVANEFFDALPVHQLVGRNGAWHERLVGVDPDSGALRFEAASTRSPLAMMAPENSTNGQIFETCPAGEAIAGEIARRVAAYGGGALIVDYGHAASAVGETLQAVHGHEYAPVLDGPGEADLTAHVDFEVLVRAARSGGAAGFGPITQSAFLLGLGIEARAAALAAAAPDKVSRNAVLNGTERLTAADQMGSLFKALALIHPDQPPPPGFEGTEPQ